MNNNRSYLCALMLVVGAILILVGGFFYLRGQIYTETVTRADMKWHRYLPVSDHTTSITIRDLIRFLTRAILMRSK